MKNISLISLFLDNQHIFSPLTFSNSNVELYSSTFKKVFNGIKFNYNSNQKNILIDNCKFDNNIGESINIKYKNFSISNNIYINKNENIVINDCFFKGFSEKEMVFINSPMNVILRNCVFFDIHLNKTNIFYIISNNLTLEKNIINNCSTMHYLSYFKTLNNIELKFNNIFTSDNLVTFYIYSKMYSLIYNNFTLIDIEYNFITENNILFSKFDQFFVTHSKVLYDFDIQYGYVEKCYFHLCSIGCMYNMKNGNLTTSDTQINNFCQLSFSTINNQRIDFINCSFNSFPVILKGISVFFKDCSEKITIEKGFYPDYQLINIEKKKKQNLIFATFSGIIIGLLIGILYTIINIINLSDIGLYNEAFQDIKIEGL